MTIPIRAGKQIHLRALHENDLKTGWGDWFNDPEITRFMGRGAFPNTSAAQRKFFEQISNSSSDAVFAIEPKKTRKFIGVAGVRNINWQYRTAELSVVIGERAWWGKGLGSEAFALLVDHAFESLNLNRLLVLVDPENTACLRSVQKAGFKKFGVGRQMYYKNGKYRDGAHLDLLRSEWGKKPR